MIRARRLRGLALVALVAMSVLVPGAPPSAVANGVPQLVKLTYVQGLSNFGPKDAEGVLEFSFAEAYARVDVKGLKPEPGHSYEGWLLAPNGDSFKIGPLALGTDGIGFLDTKLDGLKSYDYRTFVVAVRGPSAQVTGLPAERSIAGVFEILGSEPGGSARGDVRPGVLPDTGEPPPPSTMSRIVRTLAVVAVLTVVSVVGLSFIRRRRDQS